MYNRMPMVLGRDKLYDPPVWGHQGPHLFQFIWLVSAHNAYVLTSKSANKFFVLHNWSDIFWLENLSVWQMPVCSTVACWWEMEDILSL
jgi:hypothetical protein